MKSATASLTTHGALRPVALPITIGIVSNRVIQLQIGVLLLALGRPTATCGSDDNWAFRSPVRPALPEAVSTRFATNAIDLFVLEQLERNKLTFNTGAVREVLLRRVCFDLTGLPPSRSLRNEFLKDSSPNAYERLVERLLSSPAFGERWARHWLDVVRFAETDGFKNDDLRPNAYRYRDYVIRSFNTDQPYDEFVRWQIAGDEFNPENPDAIIATGFTRLYPTENNAAQLIQRRQETLDDITEVTGLTFLGLTLGCAKCHDHKYDAISQRDYFQLQAFFAGLVERDDILLGTAEEIERFQTDSDRWNEATRALRSEIDALVAKKREAHVENRLGKFRPAIQKCFRTAKEARTPFEEQVARMVHAQAKPPPADKFIKDLSEEDKKRYEALAAKLATFDKLKPVPLPTAMAATDVSTVAPPAHVLEGGDVRKPREEVAPRVLSLLGGKTPDIVSSKTSSGRRSALARWITQPEHPLTARVIVNRLWQHHFGRGIVATPSDFGVQGARPTHPELLDWLARELIESNWSLKHVHRLMVTSAAYRQSSRVDPRNATHARAREFDPENRLFWHAERRRLEGEATRDALLAVTGQLNRRAFGPSIRPGLPESAPPQYAWKPDEDTWNRQRRSIYVLAKRNFALPLFKAFDLPDPHHSCALRETTVTPTQALAMLNSELTLRLAAVWAERLASRYGFDYEPLVVDAYESAFGRTPHADELHVATAFLKMSAPSEEEDSVRTTITDFCHALLNANEFIYVD